MSDEMIRYLTTDGELAEPIDVPAFEPDIGKHLGHYVIGRPAWWTIIGLIGILATFIILGSLRPELEGLTIFGGGMLVLMIVALMFAGPYLLVDVHQDALRIRDSNGERYVYWTDVTNIQKIESDRRLILKLYRGRRVVFELPNFPGYRGLGYMIESRVDNALFDYYKDSLETDHTIDMGPIKLNNNGITVDGDTIRWEDMQSFTRAGKEFYIVTPQKLYRLTITDNQNVIYAIISEKRRSNS